jgi:uncharacterized membrane protein
MESKTKLFGHPIHPMLIVFPLGLLAMSLVFDIFHLVTGNTLFATVAYYDIAAGVIGGLLAAIFGFIDWLNVPSGRTQPPAPARAIRLHRNGSGRAGLRAG